MKKRIKLTAVLLALTLLVTGSALPAAARTAPRRSVKISTVKSNTKVYAGTVRSLKVKVNVKSSVTYKTSDSKIAKVKKGKLYAYKPGRVKVTIKAKPKSKKYKRTSKRIYIKVLPKKSVKPAKPVEPPKPAEPQEPEAPHKHSFVDKGVIAMDWTYANVDPDYDGPTNTHEKVSAANACVQCGYWFGSGDYFEDHYYDHIWAPDAGDCGGAYSLRTIYACYHLLECSCGAYRRGKLAHYEYYMYFDGNDKLPTHFTLEDWQIKEENLPMP